MKTKLLLLTLLLMIGYCFAIDFPITNTPQISVSITGYVPYPGTYKFSQVDRLSDALKKADESLEEQMMKAEQSKSMSQIPLTSSPVPVIRDGMKMDSSFEKKQALRSIRITREGNEYTYDILRFLRLGDIEQNPLLRDGDLIFVPTSTSFVSMQGCLVQPGDIQHLPGDTLQDLLDLSYGFLPGSDKANIHVFRFKGSGLPFDMQTINLMANPQSGAILINAYDKVLIPYDSEFRDAKVVILSGEIKHHGEYHVGENTTVYDVIMLAGGVTSRADLDNAVYLNRAYGDEPDAEFERLKAIGIGSVTPLEYIYLRARMRQAKGRYSIDLKRLIESEGKEGNLVVNNGDYVFFPEKLDKVWVAGQVRSPGLVPYVEGKDWKYYLNTAGGYANSRKYSGVRIIRANSGIWEKPKKDTVINMGDIVFIPDKVDRSTWVDVKDIITLVSSAITIIIGVRTLTSN